MKLPVIVLICCSLVGSNAFVTKASLLAQSNEHSRLAFERSMVPSSGDPAKAFTEYMAKSHEEKLKALKDLEDKKNSEIKVWKLRLIMLFFFWSQIRFNRFLVVSARCLVTCVWIHVFF